MASFADTAPPILTDIEAARGFIRSLDRASDLIEAACSAAALMLLALDAHIEREGKNNHAVALLETAQWLHARLAQLLQVWKAVEPLRCGRATRRNRSRIGGHRGGIARSYLRYVALGDSSTEGLDDPCPGGYRGWADRLAELEPGLYANLGVRDRLVGQVRETQLAPALAPQPDLASVVAGMTICCARAATSPPSPGRWRRCWRRWSRRARPC